MERESEGGMEDTERVEKGLSEVCEQSEMEKGNHEFVMEVQTTVKSDEECIVLQRDLRIQVLCNHRNVYIKFPCGCILLSLHLIMGYFDIAFIQWNGFWTEPITQEKNEYCLWVKKVRDKWVN